MTALKRAILLLILLIAAIGLNLALTQWGVDVNGAAILTIWLEPSLATPLGETSRMGLFAAPFVADSPWISLVAGLLVPLMLIGTMVYLLARSADA
ncbi:MAG: hypothetical protein MK089_06330 [Phycisphaerales bacterium]|nr:hypothetical protein [Phycisphaerae bacterium]MCH2152942.1 hypothetical protein [Phycisphaerales bacterium]|tara:strand:+ start:73 stop:360 length:288 start_codon:yes stop_codon:yes gene_type:complete